MLRVRARMLHGCYTAPARRFPRPAACRSRPTPPPSAAAARRWEKRTTWRRNAPAALRAARAACTKTSTRDFDAAGRISTRAAEYADCANGVALRTGRLAGERAGARLATR
eukprot:1241901-Pyramimonas_sp.AAC.2